MIDFVANKHLGYFRVKSSIPVAPNILGARRSWRWLAPVLLSCAGMAHAMPIQTAIDIYSTGAATTNTLIGGTSIDSHWTLISSPGVYPANTALYVVDTNGFPFNGAWAADYGSSARWLAPQQSYKAGQTEVAGYYVYGTTFTLDSSKSNLTTALITGQVSSDNCTEDIIINGHSTGFNMRSLAGSAPCIKTHYYFQIGATNAVFLNSTGNVLFEVRSADYFVNGLNTIEFKVNNYTGGTQNPTGLIVDLSGTVSTHSPEPASIGLAGGALAALLYVGRRWRLPKA
jgi:hypothetical protein